MLKLKITGHEVYLTPEIKEYAQEKLDKLCRHYKSIIEMQLILEEDHNKTEDKAARARGIVKKSGNDISAEAFANTPFSAIDLLEGKLRQQLEKDKAKRGEQDYGRLAKAKKIVQRLFRQD